jgi:hypothetical protein
MRLNLRLTLALRERDGLEEEHEEYPATAWFLFKPHRLQRYHWFKPV